MIKNLLIIILYRYKFYPIFFSILFNLTQICYFLSLRIDRQKIIHLHKDDIITIENQNHHLKNLKNLMFVMRVKMMLIIEEETKL